MIENELRRTFARHEVLVPDVQALLEPIDTGARRLRRRRRSIATVATTVAVALAISVPIMTPRLIAHRNHLAGPGTGATTHASLNGPMNFLILGIDRRPNQQASEPARADEIMLAHIDADHDHGLLLSVPRDLLTDIPGHGRDKINSAYAYGGRALATTVVQNLTGLTFDGTVEMRFEGLSRLTDALGGVPLCLDQRIVSIHTNRVFNKGCQRLSGDQALDLLRQRYNLPGGSIDRDRNARLFISSVLDEAGHTDLVSNPLKLGRVITAAGDAMTIDLPRIDLPDLVYELRGLRGADLAGAEVPASDGWYHGMATLNLDPDAATLFQALRSDDVESWLKRK
jgi:LCP family protein required for cell wall assembly